MNWEKTKNWLSFLLIGVIIIYGIYKINDTNKNDLSKYKGYKIEKIHIGRIASHFILVGPNKDTIDENFENSKLEDVLQGTLIQ